MNIFIFFKKIIHSIIVKKYHLNIGITNIIIEYPNNPQYGDISTNIAILIAHQKKLNLSTVTKILSLEIAKHQFINTIQYTPNGFINIMLKHQFWTAFLNHLLNEDKNYPIFPKQKKYKVNLEFVSANPTGPLHIGHVRIAIAGDVVTNLLKKYGYNITKEYYINDMGHQIKQLSRSLENRYKQILGETSTRSKEQYTGKYLIEIAKTLFQIYGNTLLDINTINQIQWVKKFTIHKIMTLVYKDFKNLNILYNTCTAEQKVLKYSNINQILAIFNKKNLIYTGILNKPKGNNSVLNWKTKKQLIYRSTKFNDDMDRTIVKSNGDYTYFATDIAYHADKIKRGFRQMIVFFGADHIGYEKRINSAVESLTSYKVNLKIKICQLVQLKKERQLIKMSKRLGHFISLKQLLNEIEPDILRFGMLQKSLNTIIDFNIEQLQQQNKNNPIFYIQYASVRSYSIIAKTRKTAVNLGDKKIKINAQFLRTPHEISLIKHLALYPKIIESCVNTLDPHKITYYLYDLAYLFHKSWNMGNIHINNKFIIKHDIVLTRTRLLLIKSLSLVLYSGLKVLGIKSLKVM